MHVLHYLPSALAGDFGSANAIRGWARAHAAVPGVRVTLVVDAARATIAAPPGVAVREVAHVLSANRWELPVGLRAALADADVVALHSGWTPAMVIAADVCRDLGKPYVVCPHGAYHPSVVARNPVEKRLWWSAFDRAYLEGAALVHVNFEAERAYLAALGVDRPLLVAPNGCTFPEDRSWDGGSSGALLWLGRFDIATKGIDLMLEGLARLDPATRPPLRMHGPAWSGPREPIEALITRLGLGPWVTFGDFVSTEEKWRLLCSARGFLYPSRWEGCPAAVQEAVGLGVPTLTGPYNMGTFLEELGAAIRCGATPEALARGLTRLLSPEAVAMAERGRQIAREHLSWDAVALRWVVGVRAALKK